ncbi:nuclear transport factor 2 family protein [Noviherbaspirillum saxi]|uniref:Nuclear transport factor 2 family protein n=1 Tax=Noviherbaspirillum saxi TaxID=2320863 RepID=A0A3A3FPI1_9BURK|nr:nuclear transport factor 2 family protein [Noviherbaspirillum saxi]RJF95362.1 nuclear transport factor 2 family protein [Noviherbaspirillum saxi]
MEYLTLCRRYLAAINARSLPAVLSLFATPDTVVRSPLYGQMTVDAYYRILFADTRRSIIRIRHVFKALTDTPSIALHFNYTWIMKNGRTVEFDGVDVFELTDDHSKFTRLTIIYDSAQAGLKPGYTGQQNQLDVEHDQSRGFNFELDFH